LKTEFEDKKPLRTTFHLFWREIILYQCVGVNLDMDVGKSSNSSPIVKTSEISEDRIQDFEQRHEFLLISLTVLASLSRCEETKRAARIAPLFFKNNLRPDYFFFLAAAFGAAFAFGAGAAFAAGAAFTAAGGTIASLQALAIRNLTTVLAAIVIVSPVAGLRP